MFNNARLTMHVRQCTFDDACLTMHVRQCTHSNAHMAIIPMRCTNGRQAIVVCCNLIACLYTASMMHSIRRCTFDNAGSTTSVSLLLLYFDVVLLMVVVLLFFYLLQWYCKKEIEILVYVKLTAHETTMYSPPQMQ